MPKPQKRARPGGAQKPASAADTNVTLPTKQFLTPPPPPSPFVLAAPSLKPLLKSLSKTHIYITSLDPHPRDFKRRLFAVPLLLNIFLAVLLLWRARYAVPTYLSLFLTALGYDTAHQISLDISETGELMMVVGERMTMMVFDFFLFRFLGGWPWAFFLGWLGGNRGLGSPVAWRRGVGFRDTEIIIRRSRRWDLDVFGQGAVGAEGVSREDAAVVETGPKTDDWLEKGRQGVIWRERIEPAVNERWVREKTGYLMMDKSWDLDFGNMIIAHRLVDGGVMNLDELQTRLLVYSEKYGGWLVWDVWEEHEDGQGASAENGGQLQLVKDKLTAMGKEDLFFRWIEVLQSDTSTHPGKFTADRRERITKRIREEFDDFGVDFEEFWDGFGGIDASSGMKVENI